jgi:hypothetical protein
MYNTPVPRYISPNNKNDGSRRGSKRQCDQITTERSTVDEGLGLDSGQSRRGLTMLARRAHSIRLSASDGSRSVDVEGPQEERFHRV